MIEDLFLKYERIQVTETNPLNFQVAAWGKAITAFPTGSGVVWSLTAQYTPVGGVFFIH